MLYQLSYSHHRHHVSAWIIVRDSVRFGEIAGGDQVRLGQAINLSVTPH